MDVLQLTPGEFKQFQTLIMQLCGVHIPETKVMLLSNRIRRRLKATGGQSFQAYLSLLRSPAGRAEIIEFLNAVTTNETSFFRTQRHFDWLSTAFVEELRQQSRGGNHPCRVRIWSAACSSGEEPYTMAMCLAENRLMLKDWTIEVLGTDISESAVASARAGVYSARSMEDVPEPLRARYFTRQDTSGNWEVRPVLKDMVSVSRHNLMQPAPHKDCDCIFIRNVLIYFSVESRRVVVGHLVNALAPGGYLVTGPSEGVFDMLGMLQKRSAFLYQKPITGERLNGR